MLLQAEEMHKMTTISLKIVKVVILFQLEISQMLNGPSAKNQHTCRGPKRYKDEPNPSDWIPPHYETYYKQDYERLGFFSV